MNVKLHVHDLHSNGFFLKTSLLTIETMSPRDPDHYHDLQILIVIVMVTPVVTVDELRMFMIRHSWVYWIGFVVFFVSYLTLVCCRSVARSFPFNIVILGIFITSTA
ncbi:hypothetical protein Y032_0348g3172 [Ancylostoma ceylanicum]|uniref:Uncharacterized protein n=1 Tax=Ancylostoma ceylanicum TaxID=53326 RepID=A0A016RX39_9BILA|nr:hypothetical protein Y032_0348g3172 [Ancylostoma ceylanicum]